MLSLSTQVIAKKYFHIAQKEKKTIEITVLASSVTLLTLQTDMGIEMT